MSYYDIDDILAETRKVPCIWHVDAFGLGELDPSADSSQRDLPKGTKVDLPLYIATQLAAKGFVGLELPPFLKKNALLEILADPVGVDLKSKSNYFYEVGCKLAIHYRPISPAIADDIITAIKRCLGVRLAHAIVKRGGSVQANDPTLLQFFDSLPELEKKFLMSKEVPLREFTAWRSGYLTIIHPSPMIQYARQQAQKRKAITEAVIAAASAGRTSETNQASSSSRDKDD